MNRYGMPQNAEIAMNSSQPLRLIIPPNVTRSKHRVPHLKTRAESKCFLHKRIPGREALSLVCSCGTGRRVLAPYPSFLWQLGCCFLSLPLYPIKPLTTMNRVGTIVTD